MKAMTAAVLLACAFAAQAQTYTARGAGTTGCGDFLEDSRRDSPTAINQYIQWTHGFLVGHNFFSNKNIDIPDSTTTRAYLEKYCRENPLSTVAAAGLVLIRDLGGTVKK